MTVRRRNGKAKFPLYMVYGNALPRSGAAVFTVGSKGYIACGSKDNTPKNDTWEYNPSKNTWTRKADYESAARAGAVGLSVDGRGFVATGGSATQVRDDLMEFFPEEIKIFGNTVNAGR